VHSDENHRFPIVPCGIVLIGEDGEFSFALFDFLLDLLNGGAVLDLIIYRLQQFLTTSVDAGQLFVSGLY